MNTFISREQDYALRITARLAELKKGERLSVRELSDEMYISRIFAARIAHKLKRAGILGANQGKAGGVFLKVKPSMLSAYDVLNVIGFKVKYNNCLAKNFNCRLENRCRFHCFFQSQEALLESQLKKMKISDFTFNTKQNKKGGH